MAAESDTHLDAEEDTRAAPVLQEALGVTPAGTCVRHPNCPVLSLAHNKVMSCRVCFSEEKSVGIRQRKSFAQVVQQLQRMSEEPEEKPKEDEKADDGEQERRERVKRAHSANLQALILQQPQTMDSVMKRMGQVQNWVLRQKEKEVLSLQLQIQRLEERLHEAETQNQEQKQTIWALRRTIQQDMKLIKTMAVQKERELGGESPFSPNSNDGSGGFSSPKGRAPRSASSSVESTPGGVGASPSMNKGANVTNMNRVKSQLEKVKRSLSNHSGVVPAYFQGSNNDDEEEEDGGEPTGQRTSYFNDAEYASMAADPTKLFASFRGGLMDIPKSPPAAHHDKRRNKLQLDVNQMSQLTVPRIRGVHRAISDDGSVASGIANPTNGGIPLGMLAAQVRSLPFASSLMDSTGASPVPTQAQSNGTSPPPPPHGLNSKQPMRALSSDQVEVVVGGEGENETSLHTLTSTPEASKSMKSILSSTYSIGTMTSTKHSIMAGSASGGEADDSAQNGTNHKAAPDELEDSDDEEDKTNTEEDDKTVDTTPTFYGEKGSVVGETIEEEIDEESKKETAEDPMKFLFPVTGASCQDKYGDTGLYTGTILVTEGMPHGKGTMNYESGRMYSGCWVSGQWHGRGKLLNANGDTYEGEFVYDARHGKGVYKWDNGDVYTGDFSLDKREGKGRFCFHNGNVYEGEFIDGMFEGFGKYTFEDGYYEGEWKDGRYHGDGELRYTSGGKYVGEFRESLANGFGMEVLQDGTKRRGVWEKGQPVEIFEKP